MVKSVGNHVSLVSMKGYGLADARLSRVRVPTLAHGEDGISDFYIWWSSLRFMIINLSMVNLASLVGAFKVEKVHGWYFISM